MTSLAHLLKTGVQHLLQWACNCAYLLFHLEFSCFGRVFDGDLNGA